MESSSCACASQLDHCYCSIEKWFATFAKMVTCGGRKKTGIVWAKLMKSWRWALIFFFINEFHFLNRYFDIFIWTYQMSHGMMFHIRLAPCDWPMKYASWFSHICVISHSNLSLFSWHHELPDWLTPFIWLGWQCGYSTMLLCS